MLSCFQNAGYIRGTEWDTEFQFLHYLINCYARSWQKQTLFACSCVRFQVVNAYLPTLLVFPDISRILYSGGFQVCRNGNDSVPCQVLSNKCIIT